MIEETAVGRTDKNASHCRAKSTGLTSAASTGTAGPQFDKKSRTRASTAALRAGGELGIQRFNWKDPLLCARNSTAHAFISSGVFSKAPMPPIPPALATAIAKLQGQAPAIGACSTGISMPKWRQKAAERLRALTVESIRRSMRPSYR